ncbi:helix-turn-helix domain-containing protein [Roseospirillum parvum]|uniref:Homeodomain-like domain-containing protein n=1 Tax=Roseospirillum parvum TaxID=83401 RepID=A0A1G8EZ96_9PROT|nr:helix-turn-helix domain-containing protein [Roseospirillum parvum]SDH75059.1 Homeodomain-like domain-containing protein [Roseospirillum parvum]
MTPRPKVTPRPVPQAYLDLIEDLGPEVAAALVRARGGENVYVPKRPRPDHPLAVALGHERFAVLVERCGGGPVQVPSCRIASRRATILTLAGQGWPRARIARTVGVTETRVYQVLRQARMVGDPEPAQPDLFGLCHQPPPPQA